MLVDVDVVERQSVAREGRELRAHLPLELSSHGGQNESAQARPRHTPAQAATRVDDPRDRRRIRRRQSVGQNHVQTDP